MVSRSGAQNSKENSKRAEARRALEQVNSTMQYYTKFKRK